MEPILFLARQWQELLSTNVALVTRKTVAPNSRAHGEPDHILCVTSSETGETRELRGLNPASITPEKLQQAVLAEFSNASGCTAESAKVIPLDHKSLTLGWIVAVAAEYSEPPAWLAPLARISAERIAAWVEGDSQFSERLNQAKLLSLEQFAAGAGHEINNPIATISGRAQQLLRGETDPDRRQSLLTIGGQALRVRDMIGDLMLFAQPPSPQPELLELAPFLANVLNRFSNEFSTREIRITTEIAPRTTLWADPAQCAVLLSELLENSMEALEKPGVIRIQAEPVDANLVLISVADNGPGIPEAHRPHLFDPFFSGRQAGRGLGFGLSKCWQIARGHGGSIRAPSTTDGWTVFEVLWPVPTDKNEA